MDINELFGSEGLELEDEFLDFLEKTKENLSRLNQQKVTMVKILQKMKSQIQPFEILLSERVSLCNLALSWSKITPEDNNLGHLVFDYCMQMFKGIALLITINRLTLRQELNDKRIFHTKKTPIILPLLCIILAFFWQWGVGMFPLLALPFLSVGNEGIRIHHLPQLCQRNCPQHDIRPDVARTIPCGATSDGL
ncbi:hypothetical protein CEXT_545041 [Caerostris extrusa]|uniref:Uncharacterized protein n=1 Tax=Caerostris extrusa TaxID=172846 RepID=A0AAV4MDI7_CAEEX|nr:hypothetical protein CEXT_545041 [Caerostris extrusa]